MSEDWEVTLATQGAVSFLGNVTRTGLGFVFVIIVTNLVSPNVYGIFTLGLSIAILTRQVSSLNLHRSLDYYLPRYLDESLNSQASYLIRRVATLAVVSSIVGGSLLVFLRNHISRIFDAPELSGVILVFGVVVVLETLNEVLVRVFIGVKRMKYKFFTKDLSFQLAKIVIALLLLGLGMEAVGLVVAYLTGVIVSLMLGGFFFYRQITPILGDRSTSVSTQSLLSYSLPLMFAGIIYSVIGQIDFFVIGYFESSAAVGLYKVGFLLAGTLALIRTSLATVFKPMVSETKSNLEALKDKYRTATRWIVLLTIPPTIILILVPRPYLELFFSTQYTKAATATTILSLGYLFNALLAPEGMMLEGLGYTRITLINSITMVAINGLLDIVLVPQFGIVGAAIGTAVAMTTVSALGMLEVRYLVGYFPYSVTFLKVILAGGITFAVTNVVISVSEMTFLTVLVLPLFVLVVNLVTLVVARGITISDKKILKQMIKTGIDYRL